MRGGGRPKEFLEIVGTLVVAASHQMGWDVYSLIGVVTSSLVDSGYSMMSRRECSDT